MARKRKQGKRTPSGQLSRAADHSFDRGSEWVQAMRARYGEYYNSPIGRAYASGLLDSRTDAGLAKARFDTVRKFTSLYRAVIGKDRYRCALDSSPRGVDFTHEPTEQDVEDQAWLIRSMDRLDLTGCRPFFDQLADAHRTFTDYGPPWLDALLSGPKDRRDTMVLDAAIKAIDAIVIKIPQRIRKAA